MPHLRASRARRAYVCAACGAGIAAGQAYFRDEPHPMARRHRGKTVRHLCTLCVTGRPTSEFSEPSEPGQSFLPFVESLVNLQPVLLQTAVVELGAKTDEGHLVQAVTLPWFEIVSRVEKDPDFLYQIPWRTLEEVVAGAYDRAGWEEVTITPRSGDRGRDVIAVKRGSCALRVIDQVKAYSSARKVTANDLYALLGVLSGDANVSKGFVTTTAEFAPRILEDKAIRSFIPNRLQLRNGVDLRSWLLEARRASEERG